MSAAATLSSNPVLARAISLCLMCWLYAAPFNALGAAVDGPILEEIIITAQKRNERLQDVPISVSAKKGVELERAQVNSVLGLTDLFANVALPDTGAKGQNVLLRIRGFGNNSATSTLRAGVIVDDVPYLTPRGLNAGIFDVERVQVLRGPQSTLYGLTAEAGLIIIDSEKPRLDRLAGRLAVQYGSEGEYLASGSLSIPLISEKVGFGVSAVAGGGDGWIDNVVTGKPYNKSQNWAARAQVYAEPLDTLSIRAVVAREIVKDSYGLALLPYNRAQFDADNNVSTGKFQSAQDYAGGTDNTDDTAALTVKWKFGATELVSVTAHRDFVTLPSFDIDQGPFPTQFGPFSVRSGQSKAEVVTFSQELRLQSSGQAPLKWTAGAFYYTRNETTLATANVIAPFVALFDVGPEEKSKFKSWSVFGQVAYAFPNGVDLSGGIRYEKAKESARAVVSGNSADTSDHVLLPKAVLSYKPNKNLMFYGSAGRGWLAGGVAVDGPTAKSETSWTYELGAKTTWLNDRLRVNFDVYQTHVSEYQESVDTGLITAETQNAGKVRFQGVDLEAEAILTPAFSIAMAIGTTDAKYRDFQEIDPNSGLLVNRAGNRIPGVPNYDANLSATYKLPSRVYFTAELNASGGLLEAKDTLNALPVIGGYSVVNLRAGYLWHGLDLTAFCNNVANREYFVYGNDQLGNGNVFVAPGRSRYYGVRIEYRFGGARE